MTQETEARTPFDEDIALHIEGVNAAIAKNQRTPESVLKAGLLLGVKRHAWLLGHAAGVAETEAKDRHYVWAEELAAERAKAAGLVIALKDVLSLNVVDGFRQRRYRAAIADYEGE